MNKFVVVCVVLGLVACGKDKGGDKSGGAAAGGAAASGGPSCAETAAQYTKLNAEGGGNHLAKLKPTPEQAKVVSDKLEAHCTSTNWSADNKTCVMTAKTDLDIATKCFKSPKGMGLQVSQVVFDAVKELKAAAPAADGSAAAGSAAAGSAEAGSAAGSAK
jgi:hypothetical protein